MSLREHAESELKLAGYDPDAPADDANRWMYGNILALVDLFASQGHSGASAAYCRTVLHKLLAFHPLTPLTGAADEWVEVSPGVLQNRRIPTVFRQDGRAYDIDAGNDRATITFPYTPSY
jgi:hypothetical protein